MTPTAKPPILTKVCTKIKAPAILEAEIFRDGPVKVPRDSGVQPKEAKLDTLLHHFGCSQ